MKEYMKMLRNFVNFEGRARRREYWVVSLINAAMMCGLLALIFIGCTLTGDSLIYVTSNSAGFSTSGSLVGGILAIPYILVSLYVLVSSIVLTVRRYHDAGVPGWVFPICLVGVCCCGIGAIAHLVICFLPSREDNKFGVNPKRPEFNKYSNCAGILVSIIIYIISVVILAVSVFANVVICGISDNSPNEPVGTSYVDEKNADDDLTDDDLTDDDWVDDDWVDDDLIDDDIIDDKTGAEQGTSYDGLVYGDFVGSYSNTSDSYEADYLEIAESPDVISFRLSYSQDWTTTENWKAIDDNKLEVSCEFYYSEAECEDEVVFTLEKYDGYVIMTIVESEFPFLESGDVITFYKN